MRINSGSMSKAPARLTVVFAVVLAGCGSDGAANQVEICDNGIDDDGDGFVDGVDFDCMQTEEQCSDGLDDDGDGDIDAADSDCAGG